MSIHDVLSATVRFGVESYHFRNVSISFFVYTNGQVLYASTTCF